jgi:hypothetical protein
MDCRRSERIIGGPPGFETRRVNGGHAWPFFPAKDRIARAPVYNFDGFCGYTAQCIMGSIALYD